MQLILVEISLVTLVLALANQLFSKNVCALVPIQLRVQKRH
jgi:hypothetical protein